MKLEDKVLERIDSLGNKAGNLSNQAMESLVKYQITYGIIDIVVSILFIALTIFLGKVYLKEYKKVKMDLKESLLYDDYDDLSGIGWCYTIILILLTLFSLCAIVEGIPTDIMRLINPEVYAVKDLIEQVKGGN
ncbi:membrane protein [Staphylococcus phage phiSA12]|uniref:Putative membrane protein n=1 Tax=Staphylococcus phage phiSA12 TaxID=1450142 RepID=W0TW43_9CAUD|nr:membrane protein [Staphylococcus phage phiSA12]BAO47213.1 putative membrane protein [Staphylococcus phage phiSA12]